MNDGHDSHCQLLCLSGTHSSYGPGTCVYYLVIITLFANLVRCIGTEYQATFFYSKIVP